MLNADKSKKFIKPRFKKPPINLIHQILQPHLTQAHLIPINNTQNDVDQLKVSFLLYFFN